MHTVQEPMTGRIAESSHAKVSITQVFVELRNRNAAVRNPSKRALPSPARGLCTFTIWWSTSKALHDDIVFDIEGQTGTYVVAS